MKAAISARYGSPDVIEIRDVPTPEPQPGDVLIRVYATTVTRTDCGMLRPHPAFVRLMAGLTRPKLTTLGIDFAGEIERVGTGVTRFAPGDRVFGLSPDSYGAHAEYLRLPEQAAIVKLPAGIAFEQAVVGEGAWYADTSLRALDIGPGRQILIYGASGAIGTAALQLAKCRGAEVTAVVATRHLDLAKSLGADRVVDYTVQDFTSIGQTFDAVFDAVGKTSYLHCRRLLKPGGRFAATDLGPWAQNPLLAMWSAITGSRRVLFPLPRPGTIRPLLEDLSARLQSGEFRAVVDRVYPLDAIADAYRYVETEQKTGIVVIQVRPAGPVPAPPR